MNKLVPSEIINGILAVYLLVMLGLLIFGNPKANKLVEQKSKPGRRS